MNIYQHFRPEERDFIDQVLEWKANVQDTYTIKLSDFLDPREQQIVKQVIGETMEIQCHFFGGTPYAERKRALIVPEYYSLDMEDFQITLFEVDYPRKFVNIEHPHVLGSIMSLGLKREKFGDIFIHQDRIQFVLAKEIQSYVQLQLTSIGRAKISLKESPFNDIIQKEEQWLEETVTVSSLRLDAIISTVYNISRQKSQLMLEQGHIKVNFRVTEKASFECGEFDIVSVRGFGRAKIMNIEGKTKKDKWRISIGKQK